MRVPSSPCAIRAAVRVRRRIGRAVASARREAIAAPAARAMRRATRSGLPSGASVAETSADGVDRRKTPKGSPDVAFLPRPDPSACGATVAAAYAILEPCARLMRMLYPVPERSAPRNSGCSAWLPIERGSNCESARTVPSASNNVTRASSSALHALTRRAGSLSSGCQRDSVSPARSASLLARSSASVVNCFRNCSKLLLRAREKGKLRRGQPGAQR